MLFHTVFKIIIIINIFVKPFKLSNAIETGYPYDVKPADRLRYLKCSYLYSGLNHLELSILNIKMYSNNLKLPTAVFNSSKYANVVSKQLSSIYGINGIEIGPLWLLNAYTKTVRIYVNHPKIPKVTMNSSTHENILKTCYYIASKYKQEIINNNCPEENIYNMKYDENFENSLRLGSYFQLIKNNCFKMESLFFKYYINNNLKVEYIDKFNRYNIILKKLGIHSKAIHILQYTYNVQVMWGNSDSKLIDYYYKPHELTWYNDHLLPFKVYYTSIFDLLQIIMLRLTLKHFMYLMQQKVEYIEAYVIRWIEILEEFVSLLQSDNVSYISIIKSEIEDFAREFPKIGNLVDLDNVAFYHNTFVMKLFNLSDKFLYKLCIDLECNANKPLKLNGKEQFTLNANDQRRLINHDIKSTKTVEVFSIENTEEFINQLKIFFDGIDFNVIRSFVNYIDEISQYKLF
ncbi:uncharacterized protein LOC126904062 [Daktulosphaira vitifoliae]|uniref:uncharacterized protein LOC126904062 n=1 Tax=Daktulosphaira vitifoliae TaxID=58002 RepID=UPI0021AA4854|nr:uncharacterized protein LOC126904062 [Daktulosphaira vitifoliae]